MPELYFNIPLANHPGLMELQDYLMSVLPPDTEYQKPENFHITLVYIPESSESELGDVAPQLSNLPMFGVEGNYLEVFTPNENEHVLVLRIEKTPQLIFLQAALFYAIRAMDLPISPYSWAGVWKPHVTLAFSKQPLGMIEVPQRVLMNVENYQLTGDEYAVIADYSLMTGKQGAIVSEMSTMEHCITISEMRGDYPNVPYFPGVNIAELTQGDDDPMFVVVPIAEDDVISANGRYYSAAFVQELERQMIEKRPTANQGHLRDEDRTTAYPTPAGYWVGTQKVGKVLWGKAYVPPQSSMKEIVRITKAAGGKITTSIYGPANQEWDKARGAWAAVPESLVLEHVDFAPVDRAGVKSLARVPHVVSEMQNEIEEEIPMDKLDILKEMTAEDVQHLPKAVVNSIIEGSQSTKTISEMRGILGVDEKADLVATVKEMAETIEKQRGEVIATAIVSEIANVIYPDADDKNENVQSVRGTIAELVKLRNPKDTEAVKTVVAEVVTKDHIKNLIGSIVVSEMGPNIKGNVGPTNTNEDPADKYLESVEE